jgi:hypothetical protein
MVFNATVNTISVISWWRKPENPEKTIDLLQITEKLYLIPALIEIRTLNVRGDRH